MTLHDAIIIVLRSARRPATTEEIASWIAERDLYCRPSDGAHAPPSQVYRRMMHVMYRDLFTRDGDAWGLSEW